MPILLMDEKDRRRCKRDFEASEKRERPKGKA
jgi:hypothetical protein